MEFEHWCGNCQIRVYVHRHYDKWLDWMDCPYVCEYATAMRCSINPTQQEYGNKLDVLGHLEDADIKDALLKIQALAEEEVEKEDSENARE